MPPLPKPWLLGAGQVADAYCVRRPSADELAAVASKQQQAQAGGGGDATTAHSGSKKKHAGDASPAALAAGAAEAAMVSAVLRSGLSSAEALARQQLGDPYFVREGEDDDDDDDPLWKKYLEQFKEPLILLLLASAVVSLLLSQWDDAASIVLAVVIVSTVAFVQEYKSEQSLAKLKEHAPQRCHLIRNGHVTDSLATELVLGDVVRLSTGDKVPADIRLLHAAGIAIDESLLTGESVPVSKECAAVTDIEHASGLQGRDSTDIPIHARSNMAFAGTLIMSGRGEGVVVALGRHTELGQIGSLLRSIDAVKTPLQEKMAELGKQLSILSFAVIAVIFLIGVVLGGHSLLEMFNVSVSLAVAAIPEGLPIVVTVTLAIGVQRMARRHAVVKRLPAVEALGSVDVVCADKTGTLTEGSMSATRLWTTDMFSIQLDARGLPVLLSLNARSTDSRPLRDCNQDPHISAVMRCAMLCNDARVSSGRDGAVLGNPTDAALLSMADAVFGYDLRRESGSLNQSSFARIEEIPFDSITKYSAVKIAVDREILSAFVGAAHAHSFMPHSRAGAGREVPLWLVKGAVEVLLPLCGDSFFDPQRQNTVAAHDQAQRLAESGLRVISLAVSAVDPRELVSTEKRVAGTDVASRCVFLGLVGVADPLRSGVVASVARCHASGVKVVMITGDAKETAVTLATELGIFVPSAPAESRTDSENVAIAMPSTLIGDMALSPLEIERMTDHQLCDMLDRVTVFYRMAPRHKLRVVRAFQKIGHTVAMTGDGVNDAPALKAADVGVAMGRGGSDVAAEASELVLLDNDFSTIVHAMDEGRQIFSNIQSFLRFQLTTSMAALGILALHSIIARAASVAGATGMPLNPMQILWINIIMDGPPAQSLGLEPQPSSIDGGVRKARSHDSPVITRRMIRQIAVGAVVMIIGTFFVFFSVASRGLASNSDNEAGESRLDSHGPSLASTAAFTVFVLFQMFNAINCRSHTESISTLGLFSNKAFVWAVGGCTVMQFAVVYFPPLQFIFETLPLSFSDLLFVTTTASSVLLLDEIRKRINDKK